MYCSLVGVWETCASDVCWRDVKTEIYLLIVTYFEGQSLSTAMTITVCASNGGWASGERYSPTESTTE